MSYCKYKHIVLTESERINQERIYQSYKLDKSHFELLVCGSFDLDVNGYCLDAPENIPAGGMYVAAKMPTQMWSIRSKTTDEIKELDAIAEKLINELMKELKNS